MRTGTPTGEKQRHEREPADIAADPRVAVEQQISEQRELSMPQVHEQKRGIVEHVDTGEIPVELDGIEQGRPALDKTDVAQREFAGVDRNSAASLWSSTIIDTPLCTLSIRP